MATDESIDAAAAALVAALLASGKRVATAESCTGGWVAKSITDVPGSSGCFGYGVVSYSNDAKERLLAVQDGVLENDGAVSEAVVLAMARGVLQLSDADLAVAVSGVAGPDGGTRAKPVGTVWFGYAARAAAGVSADAHLEHFQGDRAAVRASSVLLALQGLGERLGRL